MRKIAGKHLLCVLLLVLPLSWAEDTTEDAKKTENDTSEDEKIVVYELVQYYFITFLSVSVSQRENYIATSNAAVYDIKEQNDIMF